MRVDFYPLIIRFLGYNPIPGGTSLGELVKRERHAQGWSRRELGKVAGVDEGTILRLENDRKNMARKPRRSVRKALGLGDENDKTGDH